MLNWIRFIAGFLLVLTFVIILIVFYNAGSPFSIAKKSAIDAVIGTGQLETVERTETYNGTIPQITVFGTDKEGVPKAVFVERGSEEGFTEVRLVDGITADQAIETVKKELDVKKVLHVTLGIEEEGPVWEVAFKSENGNLNYVYVLFENGQWWKRILNL